ncbi:MAG: hypothetical protein JWL80_334 [Parcubacteria group bacterium]|nr:hypothetical protein [Parcubacteria group bacterium]
MDYLISRLNSFSLDTEGLSTQNLFDKTKKVWKYTKDSDTLVIGLPGWGQKLWTWNNVGNYVTKHQSSFLAYEFPRSILSDSTSLTKECFEEINKEVRNDIKKLKEKYGFKKCILVAISLASSYSSMAYKDNSDVTDILLIAPGENLARDMWYGCRTQHLRKSFESQGVSFEKLEKQWELLASENNFPVIKTKISLWYGKNDKVIPFKFSKKLEEVLRAKQFKIKTKITRLGHYFFIFWFLLFPSYFFNQKQEQDIHL